MKRHLRSIRDNGGLHEAGAIGLAGSDSKKAVAGTGDLTGAVVTTAAAGSGGGGDESREDSE